MLVKSTFCCPTGPGQTDFSALCSGATPIYVLFSNDINLTTSGTFKNGPGSTCPNELRYFRLVTASSPTTCSAFDAYYDACLLTSQGDGDFVKWSNSGGAPILYGNSGCTVPLVVLPIELLDFYGTQNGDKNDLIWKVAVEDNIGSYIIEKSNDGVNFEELTRVAPKGISQDYASYLVEDLSPNNGITYYRLSTIESEGVTKRYKIIDLDRSSKEWKPLVYQIQDNLMVEFKNILPKNTTISLYDLSGKLLVDGSVKEVQTKIDIQNLATGLYFVKIVTPYKTENFKIVIQK
jgi:hypothetical protein